LDGSPLATAKYLKTDRTLDTTLTATSALGCGLVIPDGQIHIVTGSLAGVSKFETQQGASASGTVFISRIHDCDVTTPGADPTCM
jgi:hypothetical protein